MTLAKSLACELHSHLRLFAHAQTRYMCPALHASQLLPWPSLIRLRLPAAPCKEWDWLVRFQRPLAAWSSWRS